MYRLFFKLDHRIGRAKFWYGSLALFIFIMVVEWIVGQWILGLTPFEIDEAPEQAANLQFRLAKFVLFMSMVYPQLAVLLKRCHDRNKSFWWLLPWLAFDLSSTVLEVTGVLFSSVEPSGIDIAYLIAFGIILLWIIIDFGILPGTSGPNKYGADPKKLKQGSDNPSDVFE